MKILGKTKTFPINEDMYLEIVQNWPTSKTFTKRFEYITNDDDWNLVISDSAYWKKFKIYIKGDITYILGPTWIFGKSWNPIYKNLHKTYWYIWKYRASDNFTGKELIKNCDGAVAWSTFTKEVRKHYTEEEIADIIDTKGTEEEGHISIGSINLPENTIYHFSNCCKYDIHKAYASNLLKFFPRLDKWVHDNYKKDKAYFKQVLNMAVGMMTRMGNKDNGKRVWCMNDLPWYKLRNTIVADTDNKINHAKAHQESNKGQIIYTRVDGLVSWNSKKELSTSDELGDFGKEVLDNGEVWMAKVNLPGNKAYTVMQYFENGKKVLKCIGGFRLRSEIINNTDLSKGIVPTWQEEIIETTSFDNTERIETKHKIHKPVNIKNTKMEIKEYEEK